MAFFSSFYLFVVCILRTVIPCVFVVISISLFLFGSLAVFSIQSIPSLLLVPVNIKHQKKKQRKTYTERILYVCSSGVCVLSVNEKE